MQDRCLTVSSFLMAAWSWRFCFDVRDSPRLRTCGQASHPNDLTEEGPCLHSALLDAFGDGDEFLGALSELQLLLGVVDRRHRRGPRAERNQQVQRKSLRCGGIRQGKLHCARRCNDYVPSSRRPRRIRRRTCEANIRVNARLPSNKARTIRRRRGRP